MSETTNRGKVAILHQGCVPVYRRAFFERLSTTYDTPYHVFHGNPPSNTSLQAAQGPFVFGNTKVTNRELKLGKSIIVYQPVVFKYLFGGFKAAVIGHEFKFLTNLIILLFSKLLRRPVVWWGFGYRKALVAWQQGGKPSKKDKLAKWASDKLALLGDGYLAYTDAGKSYLVDIGMPPDRVQVLRNTIDIEEQIALADAEAARPSAEIREELGLMPDSIVLLYIGRLITKKKIDLLIKFGLEHSQVNSKTIEILIIGDGAERAQLVSQAQGCSTIHFLGALDPSDPKIARAFRVCAAVVIPGFLGLAINHAFAHGRPVITQKHDFHSPEIDYLTDKTDGLLLSAKDDVFCEELAEYVRDEARQKTLAANALKTRENLRMDHMVRSFDTFMTGLLEKSDSRDVQAR
ncbi:putative glycosyl transferase [Roseibium album]|nr:putative glycosyl transferase [Roseibium album]